MNEELVIGIDVGTTSTKAGIYRLDGSTVATAQMETRLRRHGAGEVDQDPKELLAATYDAIAGCISEPGIDAEAISALAVTGQMAGVLGIDAAWRAVTPYDSWLDSRCTLQLRRLAEEHGELLLRLTGCPPMLDHAPKMQWWRDERPHEYERVNAFIVPAVYVAGCLAGLEATAAFTDPTYLHFTGVADARSGAWSAELLSALGLEREKLPRIVAPDTVIGELTSSAARRCGLRPGLPIAAGAGDTAAGALGAGIVAAGQLLDTAGTAAVLTGGVGDFRADPDHELLVMRGVLRGQWLPLNYVAGGGLCLPWLARFAGQPTDSLDHLLAEAARVAPGADGLLFVPHVEGRVAPYQPEMRGAWAGLSLAHSRGHFARSILEAIAFEYARYLRAMRRLHPDVEFAAARAIGGGARSALWTAIKADVLGVPVERVDAEETATRGAALVAAAAAGLIDDLGAVAGAVSTTDVVEPDAARHERYSMLAAEHAALVGALADRPIATAPTVDTELVA